MKNKIKYLLQKLLGFKAYLFWFSKFKIATLKWDKKENHFFYFMSMLPNEGVILDVGANIGIMTAWLAKEKPEAEIISFEPIKENFEILSRVVLPNSKITLNNIALGKDDGELTMIMPVINNAMQQGLSHVYNPNETYDYSGVTYKVPVKKLDDVFANSNTKIVGIKMDVENFEYEVLLGSQEVLSKNKPILYIELWDNQNRINCHNLLDKLGYSIMVLSNNKLEKFVSQETQNFFFIPN